MRQTLGLSGRGRSQARAQVSNSPKQRHRFVQDGEVQVTHLGGTRDGEASNATRMRIATLEGSLVTEQAARSRAELAVQAGMTQIHALETKLAHVELSMKDILSAERSAREQAEKTRERAELELATAIAARDQALLQAADLAAAVKQAQLDAAQGKQPTKSVTRVAKAKAAPIKTPRVKEPKPVKWWLRKSSS